MRALIPPELSEGDRPSNRVMQGVAAFTAVSGLVGVICMASAFSLHEWRTALVGSTLLVMATISGSVLVCNWMIADRQAFYQRGKVDGWYSWYRGTPPEVDDPLWREG